MIPPWQTTVNPHTSASGIPISSGLYSRLRRHSSPIRGGLHSFLERYIQLKAAKTLSRFFMAGACNVKVENGTIEVPETLAEFAGFKRGKDVVVKRREDAEISPDAGTLRSRLTECADYLVCAAGAADE